MPMTRGTRSRSAAAAAGAVAGGLLLLGLGAAWWSDHLRTGEAATRNAISGYCMECHNEADQTGGLVLGPAMLDDVGARTEIWEKVARKIADRAMPPLDQPRPDEAEYLAIQNYLEAELDAHAAARPNAGVLPQFHRLTRTEYKNAIRDLLALENLPAELDFELLLPADNTSSGFDNLSDLLSISPSVMERYIDAATKVSRLAVGDMTTAPLVNHHRMPLDQPQDTHVPGLPIGTRGGLNVESYFPLDAEYVITIEFATPARGAHEIEVLINGAPIARAEVGPGAGGAALPEPVELRIEAEAGPAEIGVTFIERTQAADESILRVRRRSRGTLPDIELVTIAGPFGPSGPGLTPSRERIFSCHPERVAGQDETACATEILTALARRAYRRPATETDVADLMPFYRAGLAKGGFDLGIQQALERLLISPQFLYRIERLPPDAAADAAFAVSDLELASRLSFFLWSSIPDEELLTLAAGGRLREPGVIEAQVRRMLADPRAESLVTNFATQWLFLPDIDIKDPDLYLFRNYDETLRRAFAREIELFVGSVFAGNSSVLDLLTANHTFVNERLAEHYGMPNIVGSHFRRVSLPADSPRAGLLGKGGILTLTSYSTRTSPVLRGKYVLDNLLASPPPAPPPDVPSLATEDEADGAALTMREALARHREDPACAGCHYDMDAIGFALENFDATGRWRDWDWIAGAAIDPASELPDGTPIDGVAGLRAYLARNPERFVRAFTEKLLMYAIGRNVQYYDAPAVRAIVRGARNDDYAFASVVTGIVRSVPFQMRNAETRGTQ